MVRRGQTLAISVCDITRPQPREIMLRAILEELDGIIDPADVVILVATGTHRSNTQAELEAMLGLEVARSCRVVNHVARDRSSLVDLGYVQDIPVHLNRMWVEADLRITTGFVEPHFFAGFSGGPKMVAPGLAGIDTVLGLHDARRIGDPQATWGVCVGNPVHDLIRAAAALAPATFSVDVLLNDGQEITDAFGGPTGPMHAVATGRARDVAMRRVNTAFDIVITSNSGYPLDQNLYQAVKGMSAAAGVVREGGIIICAAECRDGLPEHGSYAELLGSADTPRGWLDAIAASAVTIPDQWQVQVQGRVMERARVLLYSDGLTSSQVALAQLERIDDVTEAVAQALDAAPDSTICVLPQGPQTIAYTA